MQYSPTTACGTLRKQFTKPSEQVAAPPSTQHLITFPPILPPAVRLGSSIPLRPSMGPAILETLRLRGPLYYICFTNITKSLGKISMFDSKCHFSPKFGHSNKKFGTYSVFWKGKITHLSQKCFFQPKFFLWKNDRNLRS